VKSHYMLHNEGDIILIAKHLTSIKRSMQYKAAKNGLTELQYQGLNRLSAISDDFMKKATLIRMSRNHVSEKSNQAS
jgi:hypothetical protein